mgnify:CR=1 FL=1
MVAIEIVNKIMLGALLLLFLVGFYRVIYVCFGFAKDIVQPQTNKRAKFAILIAARNESKVIKRLLDSIKKQGYPSKLIDPYIIVEDENDKTVQIVKSFGYNVFVRQHLENVGKGFALDEAVKDIIKKGKSYDAYMILDADNVLCDNFIEEMNKAFQNGVRLGMGYRNTLNQPGNWVADCSALTFSGINTFQNKARTKLTKNIIVSGTGLFLDGQIIESFKGWPFHTLTEDYELSLYCCLNNIRSEYVPSAMFYDEQPTNLKTLNKQRVRWIKGFMQSRKLYAGDIAKKIFSKDENKAGKMDIVLGVVPNIIAIASIICYSIAMISISIYGLITRASYVAYSFKCFLLVFLITYLFLCFYTFLQIVVEKKKMKFGVLNSVKIILLNPYFAMLYLSHAFKAAFNKEVTWAPIEHGVVKDYNLEDEEELEFEMKNWNILYY